MSTRRKYQIEVNKIVEIIVPDKEVFEKLGIDICVKVVEKFKKLTNLLAACKVCVVGEILVINDNLNIQKDLEHVLTNFGFLVENIDATSFGLKGKTYIIKEKLFELSKIIGAETDAQKILSEIFSLDKSIEEIAQRITQISKLNISHFQELKNDKLLGVIVAAIKSCKALSVEEVDKFEITDYDGREESRTKLSATTIGKNYQATITKLNEVIRQQNEQLRKDVVTGATSVVKARATQMGYNVQERKNGDKTELILVRVGG